LAATAAALWVIDRWVRQRLDVQADYQPRHSIGEAFRALPVLLFGTGAAPKWWEYHAAQGTAPATLGGLPVEE
jgi:hypothetical protein